MTDNNHKCLYQNINGAKACYPGNSVMANHCWDEEPVGKIIDEPLRSAGGKFHKYQIINCKFPECI